MSRKSLVLGAAVALLLVCGIGATFVVLLRHEPTFYARVTVAEGDHRQKLSKAFYVEVLGLIDGIVNKRQWYAAFTEEQINSYFEEDFLQAPPEARFLPDSISEPRIALLPDKVRLAFRYSVGPWSSIVSLDLRVWLTPKEPNVVALELQGLHAGSLPFSTQSLLNAIDEVARQQHLRIIWYRHEGNPVALMRFQSNQYRQTFQLQRLELREGVLVVGGRSVDSVPTALTSATPLGE